VQGKRVSNDNLVSAVKKMREGKLTASEAWGKGLLTKELLTGALSDTTTLEVNNGYWNFGKESYEFSALLLEKFPEALNPPIGLNETAQIRVATYLTTSGKEQRGAEILENLLNAMPHDAADLNLVKATLYALNSYYGYNSKSKEPAKSIATLRRIKDFTTDPKILAEMLFLAGNTASNTGDGAETVRRSPFLQTKYHQFADLHDAVERVASGGENK
jgi:hypothetical protein